MKCPHCKGSGWYWITDVFRNRTKQKTKCMLCLGTGRFGE